MPRLAVNLLRAVWSVFALAMTGVMLYVFWLMRVLPAGRVYVYEDNPVVYGVEVALLVFFLCFGVYAVARDTYRCIVEAE